MTHDVIVSARINSTINEEAIAVLAAIGLTPSDAFRLLMTRIAADPTRAKAKKKSTADPEKLSLCTARDTTLSLHRQHWTNSEDLLRATAGETC